MVLHDADRRAASHWAEEGFGHFSDHQRALVARVLIEQAVAGDDSELKDYVRAFCPAALSQLLRDLALTFTYDDLLRSMLTPVWRSLMAAALDEIESGKGFTQVGRSSEDALAGLIPVPQVDIADGDPDAAIRRAEEKWVSPEEIADLIERWLSLGAGRPKAVDAVARLAKTASGAWQSTTGLAWVESTIAGDYALVAGACWSPRMARTGSRRTAAAGRCRACLAENRRWAGGRGRWPGAGASASRGVAGPRWRNRSARPGIAAWGYAARRARAHGLSASQTAAAAIPLDIPLEVASTELAL